MSGASFSEPFIRRPVGTTLLAVGLFLVGAVAYRFLPVASMPTVDFPTINVTASRPGADPETSRDQDEPEDTPVEPFGVFDPLNDDSGLW